ncbi:MAG: hypothetical protein IT579_25165 [Verrucomicrobia subdivision 3 bacterium]|nr:hypothetical protein [Limisphaerales bacterium]
MTAPVATQHEKDSALAFRPDAPLAVANLDAMRDELAGATTPEAVEALRAKVNAFRAMLAAALKAPDVPVELVAAVKREADGLALDVAVKLGSMVPDEGSPGARTDLGSTSPTVGEVAKAVGIPRQTLSRYRDLARAFAANATEFMSIARDAIRSGHEVPMKQLIALAPKPTPPKKEDPPKPPPTPAVPPHMKGTDAGAALGRFFEQTAGARKELDASPGEAEHEPEASSDDEVYLPKSGEEDHKRHASGMEAAVRHCLLLSVDVSTPSIEKLLATIKANLAKVVKANAEIVDCLRQLAREDADVVKAERARLTEIHKKAKADRKAAMKRERAGGAA